MAIFDADTKEIINEIITETHIDHIFYLGNNKVAITNINGTEIWNINTKEKESLISGTITNIIFPDGSSPFVSGNNLIIYNPLSKSIYTIPLNTHPKSNSIKILGNNRTATSDDKYTIVIYE